MRIDTQSCLCIYSRFHTTLFQCLVIYFGALVYVCVWYTHVFMQHSFSVLLYVSVCMHVALTCQCHAPSISFCMHVCKGTDAITQKLDQCLLIHTHTYITCYLLHYRHIDIDLQTSEIPLMEIYLALIVHISYPSSKPYIQTYLYIHKYIIYIYIYTHIHILHSRIHTELVESLVTCATALALVDVCVKYAYICVYM